MGGLLFRLAMMGIISVVPKVGAGSLWEGPSYHRGDTARLPNNVKTKPEKCD